MIFKKQILFLLSLFFVQLVFAQGGATIKASIDKNKILIGEPLHLTVEVSLSPGAIKKFIKIDSIEHFEFLAQPVIDTTDKEGGLKIKGIYTITSFDSGHWVIPSFVLAKNIKTDTIPVDVGFSSFDPSQDYHDIKDIIEVHPAEKKQWWYAAAAALLLLIGLIYLLLKKKPKPAIVAKLAINPYEEAMKQLDILSKQELVPKQYYSGLVEIFRLYIFRKKEILSLQKTTDDLIVQLKNINLDKEQFSQLSQALRLSDFVKFAKYIPSEEDHVNTFKTIKNSIIAIEKS
ncbi:MAG: hypothetical protein ABUT20_14915 [Bacteroidota bacterium]